MAHAAVWLGGLVLTWLVLMLFSGARTYTLGPFGALLCTVVIGPCLLGAFHSLRALLRGEAGETADTASGLAMWAVGSGAAPLLVISPLVALMTLGFTRFMSGWAGGPGGSMLDVVFVVIALHLLVWVGMWLLSVWASGRDD